MLYDQKSLAHTGIISCFSAHCHLFRAADSFCMNHYMGFHSLKHGGGSGRLRLLFSLGDQAGVSSLCGEEGCSHDEADPVSTVFLTEAAGVSLASAASSAAVIQVLLKV